MGPERRRLTGRGVDHLPEPPRARTPERRGVRDAELVEGPRLQREGQPTALAGALVAERRAGRTGGLDGVPDREDRDVAVRVGRRRHVVLDAEVGATGVGRILPGPTPGPERSRGEAFDRDVLLHIGRVRPAGLVPVRVQVGVLLLCGLRRPPRTRSHIVAITTHTTRIDPVWTPVDPRRSSWIGSAYSRPSARPPSARHFTRPLWV